MSAQSALRHRPGRSFGLLLLSLGTLTSAGCLEFEKQTALFVFAPDRDEVQALFVYEGLHVGEPKRDMDQEKNREANLKNARTELTGLVHGDLFYLGSPLPRIDLKVDDKTPEEDRKAIEFLKKHLTIRKGFFVTGEGGRLTYCQPIAVREPGKLVAGLNDWISASFAGLDEQPKDSIWDAKTFQMVQKAARDKHTWLKLEPGRLSYTMPATPGFVTRIKREMVNLDQVAALRKQIDGLQEKPDHMKTVAAKWKSDLYYLERSLGFLAENPWSLDVRANQMTFAMGYADGGPVRLQIPGSPQTMAAGKPEANLLAHARTLGAPFRERVDVETLLSEFQRDHSGKK
jgi:hypothetical protein